MVPASLGFRLTTLEAIDALPASEYASLDRPAGLYQSRGWLEVSEEMASGPVRYVVARDSSGRLMGLLPLYLSPGGERGTYYDPAESLAQDPPLLPEAAHPLALLGARAGYLSGWLVPGGQGPAGTARLVGLLFKEGCRVAFSLGARLVSMQFLPRSQARLLVASGAAGAQELVPQRPAARIPVPPGGFESYLAGLPAARRSTVRRDLLRYARSSCVTARLRLSEALDFAAELMGRVQDRHGRPVEASLLRRMLATQARSLDPASLVVASYLGARPIACSLSYLDGDTLYLRAAGLDHEAAEATGAYFATTFYEPIRYAGERGASWVHLGIGSLRPKVLRGARLEPLFGVFRRHDGAGITEADRDRSARRTLDQARSELGPLWPSDFNDRL